MSHFLLTKANRVEVFRDVIQFLADACYALVPHFLLTKANRVEVFRDVIQFLADACYALVPVFAYFSVASESGRMSRVDVYLEGF